MDGRAILLVGAGKDSLSGLQKGYQGGQVVGKSNG